MQKVSAEITLQFLYDLELLETLGKLNGFSLYAFKIPNKKFEKAAVLVPLVLDR